MDSNTFMKSSKVIFRIALPTFLVCLSIYSCATFTSRKVFYKNYSINAVKQANVSAPMITYKNIIYIEGREWVGIAFSADGYRYYKEMTDDSFQEDLIYTGRSANTIHVSYREYRKELARPAFFQELRYDLDKSDTIVFRNYRIKVIEATNEIIKYKVLTD